MSIQNLKTSKFIAQDAQVVSSIEDEGPRASADTGAVARTGLWVLALGFGGFLLWAGLARALYGMPALVVLDEPNANLDDEGEAALAKAVQGLKAQGKTVVLISHRPGVVSLADRLLILQNGAVQASGPRDGVMAALQKQREAAQLAASPVQPS